MFCGHCGKENPGGALFCAFCGYKLAVNAPVIEAELVPEEPEVGPAQPTHEPFMRPDPVRQVPPVDDNPAQTRRRMRREDEQAAERPAPPMGAPKAAPLHSAKPPLQRPTNAPPRPEPKPRAPLPPRKPPIPPKKKADWARVNTLIPKRKPRRDDLFFEDIDLPDETPRFEDEHDLARKIKSGIVAVCLLVILGVVFWLLVLPGGQTLRASLGMGAPATAYAQLGDQYLAENSFKRAADAYYNALRLAPDNYDYALRVGRTQQLVGDRNKALAAYAKCIALKPDQAESYQAAAELYEQMGEIDRALNAYEIGYNNTGNLDLFRAHEALKGT